MSYTKKIKLYVIGTIVVMVIFSIFIGINIKNNTYFTVDNFRRELNSIKFKEEFSNLSSFSLPTALADLNSTSSTSTIAKSVSVIVYHGIPYSDISNQFSISLEKFKDQMFTLKRAGYKSITTEQLYKYLRGEISLPKKSILITFDDGRIDSFQLADPVLKAIDYKATMFVIGRYSLLGERQNYYLSAKQLKEMEKSGRWEIEAHSYEGHGSYFTAPNQEDGHFFSHKQWINSLNRLETDEEFSERIKMDMIQVKTGLENLLNKTINSFGFPYGDFGQSNTNYQGAVEANLDEGQKLFQMAFYQNSPNQRFKSNYFINEQASNDFFMIRRIDINTNWSGIDLVNELTKSYAKDLPYSDKFDINKGWLVLWGKIDVNNNELKLETEPDETGGTIILDGSRLWQNYSLKATVASPNLSAVYVWTRFQDDSNNAACNFSNGFIHIEQTVNGISNTIKGIIDDKIKISENDFQVEVRVKDRNIQCILNDEIIVESSFLDPKLSTGGVGFKTWQINPGQAKLIIKNLQINEI